MNDVSQQKIMLEGLLKPASSRDKISSSDFNKYDSKILYTLKHRPLDKNANYKNHGDSKLLEECLIHITKYSKPLVHEKTLFFIHPFYAFLSHAHLFDTNVDYLNFVKEQPIDIDKEHMRRQKLNDEMNNYKDNLFKLLLTSFPNCNKVLVETAHAYSGFTNVLLKDGMVDTAIISKIDSGNPEFKKDFKQFKEHEAYITGSYNSGCLDHAIHSLIKKIRSERHIWVITDAAINKPSPNVDTVAVTNVHCGYEEVYPDRMITTDKFIEKYR